MKTLTAVSRVQATAAEGSARPGASTSTICGAPATSAADSTPSSASSRGSVPLTTSPVPAPRASAALNAGTISSAIASSISTVAATSGTVHATRNASDSAPAPKRCAMA